MGVNDLFDDSSKSGGRSVCVNVAASVALIFWLSVVAHAVPQQPPAASTHAKVVGEIKSIAGGTLALTTDEGKSISISLPDATRIVRIAPGQTDLKNATSITLQDLQVGDRILVRGTASEDSKSLTASTVIVMKQSDVAARQQQERDDWQKRGIGGLVSAVDPATGTVTISVTTLAGSKKVLIQTSKKTVVRHYAPNSVKFDDAKSSKLADIRPGDQLRARGTKNDDGTEFAAEEIVTGSFRNIAGTVTATNAAESSITVMDLLTKKPVVVKVTPDSQLRKLPQMMAQRIAMRLKGQTPEGQPAANGAPPSAAGVRPEGGPPSGATANANGGGAGRGGGDLQQMLSRLPAVTVSDFQKGDAVILVSTQGTESEVTAITMVGGVEPILTAAPAGGQAMILSPWSLSGGAAEGPAQ
jgi:co-chaperonin GroES (HSP10)